MLLLALYMMPIYYRSRVRSVPEFLRLRFDEPTRAFNAISFATMMVLVSGISLYAMAVILRSLLGWTFSASVLAAAVVVLSGLLFHRCALCPHAEPPVASHRLKGPNDK